MATANDDLIWKNKYYPDKISATEDIVIITRQDLVIILMKALGLFFIFFIMLLLRVIFLGFANSLSIAIFDTFFYGVSTILVTQFILIFHNYYLSMQIVTSERIIDIDQRGIFSREVNELPLQNVEDVTHKLNGFLGTVFNFGNIIVKSAGEAGGGDKQQAEDDTSGFTFNNVPNPSEVVRTISELFHAAQEEERQKNARANAEAMRRAFGNGQNNFNPTNFDQTQ